MEPPLPQSQLLVQPLPFAEVLLVPQGPLLIVLKVDQLRLAFLRR